MEVLGTILLLGLVVGVLIVHGVRRQRTPTLRHKDVILPEESLFFIADVRRAEPVPVLHFRRRCACQQVGCTM